MTRETRQPKEPDFALPWVRGKEYVDQEGSGWIEAQREARGWSKEDVYEMTDYMLDPNIQGSIEGEYGPGLPYEIDHLCLYAILFDMTPGQVLDAVYETKGRELLAEDP